MNKSNIEHAITGLVLKKKKNVPADSPNIKGTTSIDKVKSDFKKE